MIHIILQIFRILILFRGFIFCIPTFKVLDHDYNNINYIGSEAYM